MDRNEKFYKKGFFEMNSLVQEAPSISKAIELAWAKAGQPHKFSVRIYEQPEKNFFGMTKKQAKIALLFEKRDVQVKVAPTKKPERPEKKQQHTKKVDPSVKQKIKHKPHRDPQKPAEKKSPSSYSAPKESTKDPSSYSAPTGASKDKTPTSDRSKDLKKPKIIWSDEMIQTGKKWMEEMLVKIGKNNVKFSVQARRYHLKFAFESPIAETQEEEKIIFRNAAHLIMQTVRNKFKKQFRFHKVVISGAK